MILVCEYQLTTDWRCEQSRVAFSQINWVKTANDMPFSPDTFSSRRDVAPRASTQNQASPQVQIYLQDDQIDWSSYSSSLARTHNCSMTFLQAISSFLTRMSRQLEAIELSSYRDVKDWGRLHWGKTCLIDGQVTKYGWLGLHFSVVV